MNYVLEKIVAKNELKYVNWLNYGAQAITPRHHALDMIPGVGKTFMTQIITQREDKPFESFEDLEKLPGVGHKTASVVMAQSFGVPAFPVDTHVHRLAQRWGLTNGKNVIQTERDLKRIFPKKYWNKLHLQIIYYGREYCKARECYGLTCKICTTCYPNRKKPLKTKKS